MLDFQRIMLNFQRIMLDFHRIMLDFQRIMLDFHRDMVYSIILWNEAKRGRTETCTIARSDLVTTECDVWLSRFRMRCLAESVQNAMSG